MNEKKFEVKGLIPLEEGIGKKIESVENSIGQKLIKYEDSTFTILVTDTNDFVVSVTNDDITLPMWKLYVEDFDSLEDIEYSYIM